MGEVCLYSKDGWGLPSQIAKSYQAVFSTSSAGNLLMIVGSHTMAQPLRKATCPLPKVLKSSQLLFSDTLVPFIKINWTIKGNSIIRHHILPGIFDWWQLNQHFFLYPLIRLLHKLEIFLYFHITFYTSPRSSFPINKLTAHFFLLLNSDPLHRQYINLLKTFMDTSSVLGDYEWNCKYLNAECI